MKNFIRAFVGLVIITIVLAVLMVERGESPLTVSDVRLRLGEAGFELSIVDGMLLSPEQKSLLTEEPILVERVRIQHPEIGSDIVVAAWLSNEKVSHRLEGKVNGFSSRNWFFFGIVSKATSQQVREALKVREGDIGYRLRTTD